MRVNDRHYRTVWHIDTDPETIWIIDQRHLPFEFVEEPLRNVVDVAEAISDMHVRGAGCIGATAGYGMYLAVAEALRKDEFDVSLHASSKLLINTRPTAVNLAWAVETQLEAISKTQDLKEKKNIALQTAKRIANEDVEACAAIGQNGLPLIKQIAKKKSGEVVNILTHCNAGWLAFVDYGSATAPIYAAHDSGIPVHVWVDETRPRNQGARLTAWELAGHGVPHTVISDNAGGFLMQTGQVDLVITGTDRTTHTGDVANKIGTYLKALAAFDNDVPFYVALPSSTFDWQIKDGLRQVPIEQRCSSEVTQISGLVGNKEQTVQIIPDGSPAANPAFDITPGRLITGLITERGICRSSEEGIYSLFPERFNAA